MQISITRRVLCSSMMVLGAAVLAGCSMFSSPNPRFDPAPLTEYAPGVSASVSWSANIGSGGGSGFAPQVVGESVYAATPNGSVTKVDLATGAIRWQASAGTALSAGVGSDGQITAVAAPDGTVIAFDDQGAEKWRAKASSEVNIPPAVGSGVVVVRSSDYRIQALDANTGEVLWNVQRPGPALALKANMRMILIEGLLISGLPNGKFIAIDARSGSVQWEGTISVSKGATDLERISDVVGQPQTQGALLCGVSYQGRMACFDVSQGGRLLWQQPFSSTTGMTTDSQQAYASNQRSVVYAFALGDGHELWKQDALRNRALSGPAVVPQGLAVGDLEGYVHFLSRTDGHLLGRVQVGGGAIVSPLTATTRGVLVQTGNGSLVLIGVN
ncbi:outer membrane protein assembly factor BamB [Eoetvoesiella caeni]|uniref:Outer membrane protein assembly factor BamB n=1 Tax=Eoetvoesiella caeni TaxID=645616 RepID=A0A366HH30_9BURK|nr:outer membrane protein assembly factor BamB [Eoetvoesiella caeni]MCI2808418.1 outer membrane protein assembly factor BamB [Eoetvoesiella caeni]NYT54959.1 outer membrane protein assembly factor BamB [Eoetvoesiella caeni]RBP41068.1 Beta-barrel assembly machine subunit BamB [Eoetvoesiella caeni]